MNNQTDTESEELLKNGILFIGNYCDQLVASDPLKADFLFKKCSGQIDSCTI